MKVRKILPADDPQIYEVIKTVMLEHQAKAEGTILGDPVILALSQSYLNDRSVYYVAEAEGKVIGGCGINQLPGAGPEICELQRMFLLKEYRGKGIGKLLINQCLQDARDFGYKGCYLETLANMTAAQKLYTSSGFSYIDHSMGDTGHNTCDVKMYKELT